MFGRKYFDFSIFGFDLVQIHDPAQGFSSRTRKGNNPDRRPYPALYIFHCPKVPVSLFHILGFVFLQTTNNEIPKIKNGINDIGTKLEYVAAFKGVTEPELDYYGKWFDEQSNLLSDGKQWSAEGFVYDGEYYQMNNSIC